MSRLPIDAIVDVQVSTAGAATPKDGFNVGLIVGVSDVVTLTDRCAVFTDLAGMVDAGFTTDMPEYKAATLYFSQDPRPGKVVIGRRNGAENNGETWVEAITACRAANSEWYAVYCASADAIPTAQHQAIAALIETMTAAYFFDDKTAADITNVNTDVFSVIKALAYKRTFMLYSTTAYAAAAAMGFAMGANNGTANSAYTMAYKTLAGVAVDDLTVAQVGFLQGKNANYYINRGGKYDVLEKGVVASGAWFDEVLGLDQLAYEIQINCMDVLAKTRTKVPYTDAGALQFVLACNEACKAAAERGFLAPGIWRQEAVLDLAKGDTLEVGYVCQAVPVAERPASEKSLRICPPVYVCVNLAGAIHQATIKVNVQ